MEVKVYRVLKGIIYKGFAYKPYGLIVESANENDVLFRNLLKFITDDQQDEAEHAKIFELKKGAELKLKRVEVGSIKAPPNSEAEVVETVRKLQDLYLKKAEEKLAKELAKQRMNNMGGRIAQVEQAAVRSAKVNRKNREVQEI